MPFRALAPVLGTRTLGLVILMIGLLACDGELASHITQPSTFVAEQAGDDAGVTEDREPMAASGPFTSPLSPWCRVRELLQEQCQGCHGAELRAGAPMPLVGYDDLLQPGVSTPSAAVYELVRSRTHDESRPMPPEGLLEPQDLAVLDAWLAAGHQGGSDPDCLGLPEPAPSTEPEEAPWPADCEAFYTIFAHDPEDPSKPFRVPAGKEVQIPLAIDEAPWGDEPVQALMFKPRNDNLKVLHHWNLFEGEAGSSDGAMLWGWAPGNRGTPEIPSDVGLYLPRGPLNLEMHYYNVGGTADELDRTGVEICVTRSFRPHTASITRDFNAFPLLLPNQKQSVEDACRVVTTTEQDIHLIGVIPHMHKLGVRAFLSVNHDGSDRTLLDLPYSFYDQRVHPLKDERIRDGDLVTTRCSWNNTTSQIVGYGPSSDQEMCANFAIYWPKDGFFCAGSL